MNTSPKIKITSWSRRPSTNASLRHIVRMADLPPIKLPASQRGAGPAYGDCCIPEDRGCALNLEGWNQILHFNSNAGIMECRPGLTLRDLLQVALPKGFFLGASPGTMKSTIGGCVACDVHGKNHHAAGSFIDWVEGLEIFCGDGALHSCSREENSDLFWATAGGLGHTGVITRIRLRLQRISSGWIKVQTIATPDLDATLAAIESNPEATYSVSWLDSMATGSALGRGVVMLGEHARPGDENVPNGPSLNLRTGPEISIPFTPPSWASPPVLWTAFNAAYYHRGRAKSGTQIVRIEKFFYPLDSVRNWNVVYGKRGFLEYQVAVPQRGGLEVCRTICQTLAESGNGSFLAVIKKFGLGNQGHLSFPIEGYTLAVDMPYQGQRQEAVLRRLDELVISVGGRVYLVKDTRLPVEFVPAMYPRLGEWREIVERYDPNARFVNHATKRLKLRETAR